MSTQQRILLCLAHLSGEEQRFVREAFESNWVVPLGPHVDGFEEDLKQFMGGEREVVALASGTAALHLALRACGVGPGDEVLVQSFTFCASANPITYLGATPVFIDSERASWNMDPALLEEAIRDRIARTGRKPRAILPVALYGMPCRIDELLAIADRYGIPLIEDAAEALGSTFDGRRIGTFGRYGALSFNGNKMITTSGGGALLCPDEEAKREIAFYATQAREPYPYYQHERIGYNYRLSNICAAIGRGQMQILQPHIDHHRHTHALYRELLHDVAGITLHENPSPRYASNFWLNTILLDPALPIRGQERAYAAARRTECEPNANVEALRRALDEAGIESRPLWKPLHRQPVYATAPAYVNGVSERLFRVGLCLPSGPHVTDEQIRRIVRCIREQIA